MSGGRGVPQFPGKVEGATEHAWTQQMCPILTSAEVGAVAAANKTAELQAATTLLTDAAGGKHRPPSFAKVEARRCQGPACAFFIPIGTKGDGGCAEALKVTTMHSQNLLLEAIALKLGAITKDPAQQATQQPAQG
jgi:hypothetical protein